jgi:hypothetical protein
MTGRRQHTPQQGSRPVEDYRQSTSSRLDVPPAPTAAEGRTPLRPKRRTRKKDVESVSLLFKELAEVALAVPVHDKTSGRNLPAGAHGTVVGVWQGGRAYEVEFSEPFACLVTVPAEGLSS